MFILEDHSAGSAERQCDGMSRMTLLGFGTPLVAAGLGDVIGDSMGVIGDGRHHVIGRRATVTPLPARVNFACVPKVPPVEIGPQRVKEYKLGISGLPQQEVGEPLLAG